MIDPNLTAALKLHRHQMSKSVQDRSYTFFMFNTLRVDGAFNVFNDGPRVGFNAETLARLLVLFPQWDIAEVALKQADLKSSARLSPVVISTDEIIFDEWSQTRYATQIRMESARGVTMAMRDPATGTRMHSHGGVTAHEMLRTTIERWSLAEQVTVSRVTEGYLVAH